MHLFSRFLPISVSFKVTSSTHKEKIVLHTGICEIYWHLSGKWYHFSCPYVTNIRENGNCFGKHCLYFLHFFNIVKLKSNGFFLWKYRAPFSTLTFNDVFHISHTCNTCIQTSLRQIWGLYALQLSISGDFETQAYIMPEIFKIWTVHLSDEV